MYKTVNIPSELHKRLKISSIKKGMTLKEFLIRVIGEGLLVIEKEEDGERL